MKPDAADETSGPLETWFVRQGLPHLIADYSARTDVFTRAAPFLVAYFLLSTFFSFSGRLQGGRQALAVLVTALALGAAGVLLNRWRGRRASQVLPDRVGFLELAVFVLVPAVAALFRDHPARDVGLVVATNLVVLFVVWLMVGYGFLPMTRWALVHTFRQLGELFNLVVRSLPLVLLFATFLFINAEIWQVAAEFSTPFFLISIGMLVGVGILFVMARLPREIRLIARFSTWDDACQVASSTNAPLGVIDAAELSGPVDPALDRWDRLNLQLVILFSQGVQILLVAAVIGLFYFVFGIFAIGETTIEQWTDSDPVALAQFDNFLGTGDDIVLTRALVRVSAFIAAFSGLQFAVSALTDATYREEFFENVVRDVRGALAVRAVYLGRLAPDDRGTTRSD